MASYPEMISGPDLGGGCLHQLTRAPSGSEVVYTFHAQSGGADASGPPIGSLEPLGWLRPERACQFGGSGCWHREFVLTEADDAGVRTAYQRTRSVLGVELAQVYRGPPTDGEPALRELTDLLVGTPELPGGTWWISGRWAARLQGVPWPATTVQLGCRPSAVRRIADALSAYLIEPASRTAWPGRGEVSAGRAFVGTFVRGTRVEWSSPSRESPSGPVNLEWSGQDRPVETATVEWEGRSLSAVRLEYLLGWTALFGEQDDLDRLAGATPDAAFDGPLLRRVLLAAGCPESSVEIRIRELRSHRRPSPPKGSGPSASS